MYLLRLMLVGVWLGLLWVLFYFFDHYIQSSPTTTYSTKFTYSSPLLMGHDQTFNHFKITKKN